MLFEAWFACGFCKLLAHVVYHEILTVLTLPFVANMNNIGQCSLTHVPELVLGIGLYTCCVVIWLVIVACGALSSHVYITCYQILTSVRSFALGTGDILWRLCLWCVSMCRNLYLINVFVNCYKNLICYIGRERPLKSREWPCHV